MPSRKSDSSETGPLQVAQPDTRRTALRRLSSIASFQSLFARRRSNNGTDATTASSSSNISLTSSTIANAPEPRPSFLTTSKSGLHEKDDTLSVLPQLPEASHAPARGGSYVCLPNDPVEGISRSRTTSNLPLPTRNAKKSIPLLSARSYHRLPSNFLPSSRLPSPITTTRKHSHTKLASIGYEPATVKTRMIRSDTEPLLNQSVLENTNRACSTAFKENVYISPVKTLPFSEMFSSRFDASSSHVAASIRDNGSEALFEESRSPSPVDSGYADHPAIRMVREYKSSPAQQHTREKHATSRGPKSFEVPRWSSQPILTDATNGCLAPQRPEIKELRLMSARQAPSPLPAKTALPASGDRVKIAQKVQCPIRQVLDSTPSKIGSATNTPTKTSSLLHVRCLQIMWRSYTTDRPLLKISLPGPAAYWSGRLCALTDHFRNEELAAHLAASVPFTSSLMHTPDANTARFQKAFDHLHNLCVTAEAELSLQAFRLQFAKLTGLQEELGGMVLRMQSEEPRVEFGIGEARKASFIERLLGKRERRSLGVA